VLDCYAGSTSGDFTGMLIESNSIDCDNGMCCFGIELGPHPWYQSAPIGGAFTVRYNYVNGAGVGINVDAGGYVNDSIILGDNVITRTQKTFTCGALCMNNQPGSDLNVSPDSVVEIRDGNSVHGNHHALPPLPADGTQITSTRTYACV
jgi:hypothetical protein